MRAFLHKVARVVAWVDDIEFATYAISAVLLLVTAPPLACLYFLRMGHDGSLLLCGSLWIWSTVICIRDLRRRRFSPMSLALGLLWLFATMLPWWMTRDIKSDAGSGDW